MAGTGVDVNSPTNSQWPDGEVEPSPRTYALSGKIMLTAIVVLFAVVIFLVVLHLYARWYLLRVRTRYPNRRRNRRRRAANLVFYVDPNSGVPVPTGGLDASVLASLPVFVYSPEIHESLPECAVCLSEFEEGEKGRTLPKCHHSFHTECIDMWFNTHSTCPLCRSPVEPDFCISFGPTVPLPEPDSGTAVCCPAQHDGECSGTTSLGGRRIGLNVRIDVPRRNELVAEDEFRLPSPASQGYRSPGSRLLSLKRILSMNRKSPASSPSSGVLTNCGSIVTESDLESAKQESISRPTTPR